MYAEAVNIGCNRALLKKTPSQKSKPHVVVFDLETTSCYLDSATICQIAAECDDKSFDVYVAPQQEIDPWATAVNHLTYRKGELHYKGKQVNTVCPEEALKKFIKWIPQNSVLVAHCNKRFDAQILVRCAQELELDKRLENRCYFSDTHPIFKEKLPGRISYSLMALVEQSLGDTDWEAHNAIDDVKVLRQLMTKTTVDYADLEKHSFTVDCVRNRIGIRATMWENLPTLFQLISEKVITQYMAEKIAKSGLTFGHLNTAFMEDEQFGLTRLLSEIQPDGKPRVTKTKRIIRNIASYFEEAQNNTE
ncbi:uncharacterized protein LOC144445275 [Glandiceps talaboti]